MEGNRHAAGGNLAVNLAVAVIPCVISSFACAALALFQPVSRQKTAFAGHGDHGSAAAHAKLSADTRDVGLDRLRTDVETFSDGGVGEPWLCEQRENLLLALGETYLRCSGIGAGTITGDLPSSPSIAHAEQLPRDEGCRRDYGCPPHNSERRFGTGEMSVDEQL